MGGDGSWELLWSSSAPNADRAALQDDIQLGGCLPARTDSVCLKGNFDGDDLLSGSARERCWRGVLRSESIGVDRPVADRPVGDVQATLSASLFSPCNLHC